MNQRHVIGLSAITVLGLAASLGSAVAQQKSLKEQLVGSWTLVSCPTRLANGAQAPQCVDPSGILILDASGRYAQVLAARGRPKVSDNAGDRTKTSAEEYKGIAQGVVANFGTWSVNEADKSITRHFEGALFPNAEGTDAKDSVNLAGDEVKFVSQQGFEAVYRRAK